MTGKTKEKDRQLDAIRQSRPRDLMPRPVSFRSRKKYDRKAGKASLRKLASD